MVICFISWMKIRAIKLNCDLQACDCILSVICLLSSYLLWVSSCLSYKDTDYMVMTSEWK